MQILVPTGYFDMQTVISYRSLLFARVFVAADYPNYVIVVCIYFGLDIDGHLIRSDVEHVVNRIVYRGVLSRVVILASVSVARVSYVDVVIVCPILVEAEHYHYIVNVAVEGFIERPIHAFGYRHRPLFDFPRNFEVASARLVFVIEYVVYRAELIVGKQFGVILI